MSASPSPCHVPPITDALHARFLTLLPKIQAHAQIYFRDVRCPGRREDAVQECAALAWRWYCRLAERGKDACGFPMAFAFWVAVAVRRGRRLAGAERAHDVLSPRARRRKGIRLEALPASTCRAYEDIYALVRGRQELDAYEERLADNRFTPPPEAAAFRLDFPQFLSALSDRDRQLAMYLSLGHSGKQAARRFGLSPGRVTQLRQQWHRQWLLSQGQPGPGAGPIAQAVPKGPRG
jgi:DNA-directed RNA polymerase specialized sigma24 family protein